MRRNVSFYMTMLALAVAMIQPGWAQEGSPSELGLSEELYDLSLQEVEECRQNLEAAWKEIEALRDELGTLKSTEETGGSPSSIAQMKKELEQRDALLIRLKSALLKQKGQIKELEKALAQQQAKPPPGQSTVSPEEDRTVGAPSSAFRLIVEGNRALRQNDLAAAERAFRGALAQDRSLMGARIGMAAVSYTRGDLSDAKKLLGKLLGEDPNNAEALGLAGVIAWQEGDVRLATQRMEKALRIDPKNAQLHNYMGIILHSRGEPARAIRELRRAVELDPQHAEAMFNLAVLLATSEPPRMDEAERHYKKAVKLGSDRDEKLENILYQ